MRLTEEQLTTLIAIVVLIVLLYLVFLILRTIFRIIKWLFRSIRYLFTFKRLVDKSTGTAGNPVSELTPAAAFTGEATKKASQGKAFQGETVVSNRVVFR